MRWAWVPLVKCIHCESTMIPLGIDAGFIYVCDCGTLAEKTADWTQYQNEILDQEDFIFTDSEGMN